jgi:hypothetical protein
MMSWLADWWWALIIPVALFGLHRLALWLEAKGLIYYRKPPARGTALALMSYQRLFEPSVEHVIEYQRSGDLTIQTSGEPEPPPPEADAGP